MSYIGNTQQNQSYVPAIDYFSGNGSTTAFTLSRPVASVAAVQAVISNVPQNPGSAFTVSGSTITFTSAPPSGTNNIYVYYTSPNTQLVQPGQGTVGTTQLANGSVTNTKTDTANLDGTGALTLPTGTTAQRPGTPVAGQMRYNSTTGSTEIYQGGVWSNAVVSYPVDFLVIAGGGSGGYGLNYSGGGGAGGFRTSAGTSGGGASAESQVYVSVGTPYTVTVGGGGAGGSNTYASGSNSVFSSITSIGGGYGSTQNVTSAASGGSGGGSAIDTGRINGSGTSGQGYAGGLSSPMYPSNTSASGGGGAGSVGGAGSGTGSSSLRNGTGVGGNGVVSSITGSSVTYAGGGGGAAWAGGAGTGTNGGGDGGISGSTTGGSGTANTGGGGGGAYYTGNSGSGGSGIVVIRYLGSQRATGGTVTSSGGYTIHTFTSSGTFTA